MPTVPYAAFRRMVRALRLKRGLTQEQLAERAGLDYKYYQRLELGGTSTPALGTLEGLGRALGVKPWVLICDERALVIERTGVRDTGRKTITTPGRPRKT